MSKTESVHNVSLEAEKADSSYDTITSIEDKDEALRLVGLERAEVFSEEAYRQVRRKLDRTIPPLCAAVYFTQYLWVDKFTAVVSVSKVSRDKNVLNYASIMGLPITGQHYNLVALAFYLGFFIWVFPTMYISQRLRIGKYLGTNVVLWGIIMILHAVPESFGPFFVLRILLGMLESCVGPTLILIISMFYKKNEQATRISWFYLMNGVSGIFGGFVAYGISFDTNASIKPYKIMYYLCGSLAILVGAAVLLWMPDSPVHARFLTPEERVAAVERIRDDQGGTENKKFKKEQVIEASKQALILSAPSGVIGIMSALVCGWYSDRKDGTKYLTTKTANYIVTTFGSSLAIIYAYNASNTSGHTKKVTINAMTLAAFCAGNIIGAETFLPKDAPNYIPGKTAILVLLCSQIFICFFLRWVNLDLNKKKRKAIEGAKERNGWTDGDVERERQRHAFLDMTDRQ
ncbi:hypothetical protein EIP86_007021 [Pleurotus ostreatoroseus]|nr:hypothetical protein EIP86_007021 [Pleurotus ostreatoroseus]